MSKSSIVIIVVLAILGIFSCNSYNGMNKESKEVDAKWAEVTTQYQRRSDLIGNLVNVVKGYANHEKSTLVEVIKARNEANMPIDPSKLDAETIAKFQENQANLSNAYKNMIKVQIEAYPDLKANQNFLQLQDEITGTENRVAVARGNFNETVKSYNLKTSSFPAVIFAKLFGYNQKEYFKSDPGTEKAPKVEF